jgi:hypothetical protein
MPAAQRCGRGPATEGPLYRASVLGAKYVLWRQADTDRISLRWFIFVTLLRQGEYDDGVEV